MQLVLTRQDPCWVCLHGARGRFLITVKAGVRPLNRRKFDHETQTWLVHWHWLHQVVTWARQYYERIDYSDLPPAWQLRAAGAPVQDESLFSSSDGPTPYERLFVAEEAPHEVVHAAYKALARIRHPDTGGTSEGFREIQEAYEAILKIRGLDKKKSLPADSAS